MEGSLLSRKRRRRTKWVTGVEDPMLLAEEVHASVWVNSGKGTDMGSKENRHVRQADGTAKEVALEAAIPVRVEGNAVDKAENGPEEVAGPEIVVAVAAESG